MSFRIALGIVRSPRRGSRPRRGVQPLTTEQEHHQLLAAGLDEQAVGFTNLLNANMADGVSPTRAATCPG